MILIHGSGVVRAGQWARRLIINEDLDKGTQLPYVSKAKEMGCGVVVLNTNYNKKDGEVIKGSARPSEHAITVWESFIKNSKVLWFRNYTVVTWYEYDHYDVLLM